jgi:GNAT superfamily N-acetyltransferase
VTLADRLAAAYAEVLQRSASRGGDRSATTVCGLPVLSLGLPERWANVVLALDGPPNPSAVTEALASFTARGLEAQVMVREAYVGDLPHLATVDEMPAYVALAIPQTMASRADEPIEAVLDPQSFADVYGAAFQMRAGMAAALVDPGDMGAPGTVHLVARDTRRGMPVGCALLRIAGGLGYVSAVGVRPEHRGRGIGTALLDACSARAAEVGCSEVWLHATRSARAFYAGLGYELVDTHVALG